MGKTIQLGVQITFTSELSDDAAESITSEALSILVDSIRNGGMVLYDDRHNVPDYVEVTHTATGFRDSNVI